jgi:hypothetical protein
MPARAIIAIVTVTTSVLGCRCPSGGCLPATPCAPCSVDPMTVGEATPPDLMRAVPDCNGEYCGLRPLPTPEEVYHTLTPADCQCRAATNANVANMIELEEHWAGIVIECDSKYVQRNVCLQRDLLELHAADLRNKAAGNALEAFYQLAALEARRHYLAMAIDEAAKSVDRADKLQDAGTAEEVDREDLAMRLSEFEDQRLQLDYARVQLNGQLQKLVGCPVSEYDFFWPVVDWTPDLAQLDAEAELAAGLPNRFDLRGISLTSCKLQKSTLRVARGVLGVVDGTLGSVEPTPGWIHRLRCLRGSQHEVDVRCRQLALLYSDTEQLATAEIKGAVYQVALQQQRVIHARQTVEDRRTGLYSLTAQRDVNDTPVFEVSRARMRLYDAESDLIEQVASLKVSQSRLTKAQAMLAAQCGFEPKLCCEGNCTGECQRCVPTCAPGCSPCKCAKCPKD